MDIKFNKTYQLPDHVLGDSHGIAQILLSSFSSRVDQDGLTETRYLSNHLDGGFPNTNNTVYTYQNPVPGIGKRDTPLQPLYNQRPNPDGEDAPPIVAIARDESFTIYLMYKPAGPGDNPFIEDGVQWTGHWVPVAEVDWNWGGAAEREGLFEDPGEWHKVRGEGHVTATAANPEYPTWSGDVLWHKDEWS